VRSPAHEFDPLGVVSEIAVRRELRDGDAEAIVELHERLYSAEFGMDTRFTDGLRR